MEVYIDIYIFENIVINLFLLLLTFKLLRFSFNKKNICIAAVLGGLYGLVIFCNVNLLNSIAFKLLIPAIMIYISLESKKFKYVLKSILVFFMLAFMLGGICFGALQMQNTYMIGQAFVVENNSIKYIVLSVAIVFIFINRIVDLLKDRALVKNFLYDIYITEGTRTVLVKGFLDTGNELREPITNLPCILIENEYFLQLEFNKKDEYVIRYKTIDSSDVLHGFRSDFIKIKGKDDSAWREIDAIICGCKTTLSKENDYQVLLSRGII